MESDAVAGPGVPEIPHNTELWRFSTSRGKIYNYGLGHFLTIQQISTTLQNKDLFIESEARMLENLEKVKSHHFPHTQVPLPVSSLQHVTEEAPLTRILEQGCFRITKSSEERPEFRDLLFWSADISSPDIEKARQEMYEAVRRVITPGDARKFEGELKEQFATSPAFNKSASRYGNFRFSFPLSELLSLYKTQHCDGGEPQLRILGTEVYRQKIAHYIVVHSPHTNKYDDFPTVPSIQLSSSEPLPFVYRDGETLYWRPESTSIALKVKISENGQVQSECYKPCEVYERYGNCCHLHDGTYSVWNHLTLAFHLPEGGHLNIPRGQLLDHLTPCDGDEPFLGKDRLTKEEAEEVIQGLRQQYNLHY
ncbi:uncharacterized protein [Hyperolius riggenbachi]|uniref:uncharacterized protein n=1 Tax=Hyperolius riggenbachi TaxID=752182 RepID=UPI0035A3980F